MMNQFRDLHAAIPARRALQWLRALLRRNSTTTGTVAVTVAGRTHVHRRNISIDAYLRDDGLWDIEGRLSDIRDDEVALFEGARPAGVPVHDMTLRIVVDTDMLIRDAHAGLHAMPYPSTCSSIATSYQALVGLRIGGGFNKQVAERLGGVKGCTHVTNLAIAMATAAFQSVLRPPGAPASLHAHSIGGCHTLRRDGDIVRRYGSKTVPARDHA